MSLKSKPLTIEGTFTEIAPKIEEKPEFSIRADCWCSGRHNKLHKVGDPLCQFPVTFKVPEVTPEVRRLLSSPVTFDEDLIMACINRAIMKTPADFVPLLEEGRVTQVQARRINNELRLMGYCVTEEPF